MVVRIHTSTEDAAVEVCCADDDVHSDLHMSSIVVALACAPSPFDHLTNLPGWPFCFCEVQ